MGLFKKKKKKTVYSVSTAAAPMFDLDKDLLKETIPKLVMQKIQTNQSAKDYILNYANSGAAQLLQYYNTGKHDFMDKLPESTISAFGVPSDIIEGVIKKIENTDNILFKNTTYNVPENEDWIEFQLQNNYDYNVNSGTLKFNDKYYSIIDYEYDEVSDKFKVKLKTLYKILEQELKEISVFVENSPIEENNIIYYNEITTIKYINVIKGVEDSGIETELNKVVISEETTEKLIKEDDILEFTDLIIISENITPNPEEEIILNTDTYKDDYGYYYALYTIVNTSTLKVWFYDPALNIHKELTSKETSKKFDTYPITLLRQNVFSVNEYNKNSKIVHSGNRDDLIYRPNNITNERYNDTKNILKSVGLDVETVLEEIDKNKDVDKLQDAFITVGLSPSNKAPIVSKGLFILFDYFYNQLPPTKYGLGVSYRMSIQELPYNAYLEWSAQLPYIKDKIIGKKDTYKHSIITKEEEFIEREYTFNYTEKYNFGTIKKPDYGEAIQRVYRRSNGIGYSYKRYRIVKKGDKKFFSISSTNQEGDSIETTYKVLKINKNNTVLAGTFTTLKLKVLILEHQINNKQVRIIEITNKPYKKRVGFGYKHTYKTAPIWVNSISGIARNAYRSGTVNMSIDDTDLVIPIPTFITSKLSYMEQVSLMGASLYTVFYAAQYDRITYYKSTGFGKAFGFIIVAIAIVINIITYGGSTPLTVAAVGLSIVKTVAIGLALTIALNLIADVTNNPSIRTALSVVAMVVAAYASGGFNNFEMNFSTAANLSTMPVRAFNIYVGAETELVMSKMASLENKSTAFMSQYENKSKQFENIIKNLSSGIDTEFLVELSTDVNSSTTLYDNGTTWSPSFTRYMLIDSYKDFDLLYKNSIEGFVDKQLKVGLIDI